PRAVLLDHLERGRGAELLVRERDRRRAAELVALESEQARRGAHDAGSVDDAGADSLLVRPEAELDVGRRRHRVAGDEEGHGPVAGGFQDLRALLEVLPGQNMDRLPYHEAEGLECRPPEGRRVELRE